MSDAPVVSDILSSPWCHACIDQNINQKPRNSPHRGRILPDAGSSNFPEARSAASELRYAYGGTKQALHCVVIILTELKRSQG